jgi:DNA-binding transcriptional regulator YdaS (Cro superfamily)
MTIKEYLAKHAMTHREFGQLVGLTEGMVSHYINGRHLPRLPTALRIEQVTNGEVTRADLLPELFAGFSRD